MMSSTSSVLPIAHEMMQAPGAEATGPTPACSMYFAYSDCSIKNNHRFGSSNATIPPSTSGSAS